MINFSICLIIKEESKTLPRCIASLKEFMDRGGECVVLDTGSKDNSVQIAKDLGCKVYEAGTKYQHTIDKELSDAINEKFVVEGEEKIVKEGDTYFHFADARNHAASLASNDVVSFCDADEIFTVLDIDRINKFIEEGFTQWEYNFVFAVDQSGNEAIKFIQSKMYDRRVLKWQNPVHEILVGNGNRKYLDESIFKLVHHQNQETGRHTYLKGLSVDAYQRPLDDRASHYFGRELFWSNRNKSAIKEFQHHVSLNGWVQEKGQSYIFIGDAYGKLNMPQEQCASYSQAFYVDSSRREALIKLALFYKHNSNFQAAISYAEAALTIPYTPYYANDMAHYTYLPHEIIYFCAGWRGDIEKAKEHLLIANHFAPHNPQYIRDTKYYFDYAAAENIQGWMSCEELMFLYETAKHCNNFCECGSWMGKSTNAILTGCKGEVVSVDTWLGSQDVQDATNWMAKTQPVFEIFKRNTQQFKNLKINRKESLEAVKDYPDKYFSAVFIDAEHTYESVKNDIEAWLPKCKLMICGHDYSRNTWMRVCEAVDSVFGEPDEVHDTIWVHYVVPKITFLIPQLGRPDGLKRCLDSIKNLNYPPAQIETIVLEGNDTVPQKIKRGLKKATGEYIAYLANDVEIMPDALYIAIEESQRLNKGLVSFNEGELLEDEGNISAHFIIRRDLIYRLEDQEIFSIDFSHVGCDNYLWYQCKKFNEAYHSEKAKIIHHHFSNGAPMDEIYESGWKNIEADRATLREKLNGLNHIPRKIVTCWLSEEEMPEQIKKCIESQKIKNYTHHVVDLKECESIKSEYLQQAITAKKWVKATDWLRMKYLFEGCIFLDADTEILKGKNFDSLLHHRMFAAREENGFIGAAVIGAEKGYPFIKSWMQEVEANFRGDDDKNFESSMDILVRGYFEKDWYKEGFMLVPTETFYPMNHQTGITKITNNTICLHHFLKSWVS